MRKPLTVALIVVGLALMLIGYVGSAPWGADTVANSDPRFDFAPAVFVLGIFALFSSALVYEIRSDHRDE